MESLLEAGLIEVANKEDQLKVLTLSSDRECCRLESGVGRLETGSYKLLPTPVGTVFRNASFLVKVLFVDSNFKCTEKSVFNFSLFIVNAALRNQLP